jgi:hypothetical protein
MPNRPSKFGKNSIGRDSISFAIYTAYWRSSASGLGRLQFFDPGFQHLKLLDEIVLACPQRAFEEAS